LEVPAAKVLLYLKMASWFGKDQTDCFGKHHISWSGKDLNIPIHRCGRQSIKG